jgi:hypothetical protein
MPGQNPKERRDVDRGQGLRNQKFGEERADRFPLCDQKGKEAQLFYSRRKKPWDFESTPICRL